MTDIKFILYGNPASKKNSMQVGRNRYTGKTFVSQNKNYLEYEKDCLKQICFNSNLMKLEPINEAVNVQCVYYRDNNRRCDLPNLINATLDVLVKGNILADDNFKIVAGLDGSRVFIDKGNPRTEIIVTKL